LPTAIFPFRKKDLICVKEENQKRKTYIGGKSEGLRR